MGPDIHLSQSGCIFLETQLRLFLRLHWSQIKGAGINTPSRGGARSFTSHGTFQLNLCKLSRHICVRLTQGRVQGGEADPESIHWTKTESGAGDLRLQKFQKPVVGASGRRLRTTREETRMCEGPGLGSPCTTPRDSAWLAPPVLALLTTLAVLLLKTFCWVYCSKNLLCLPTCLLIHLSHGSGFKRPSLFPTPYCLG